MCTWIPSKCHKWFCNMSLYKVNWICTDCKLKMPVQNHWLRYFKWQPLGFKCVRHCCEKLENGSVQQKRRPRLWNLSLPHVFPFLQEQQWKLSMYSSSIAPVCFTSPLIEKPIGKVRMNPFLTEQYDLSMLAVRTFGLELFGWNNQMDLIQVADKNPNSEWSSWPQCALALGKMLNWDVLIWDVCVQLLTPPRPPSCQCPPHSFQCSALSSLTYLPLSIRTC